MNKTKMNVIDSVGIAEINIDNQCGICLEPMAETRAFITPPEAGSPPPSETSENTSRFLCGHAFHSSCAVQSLLVSYKCPSCRTEINGSSTSSDELDAEEIRNHIINEINRFVEDPLMDRDPLMTFIRSRVPDVQRARQQFRQALANYNQLQDRMRHLRRVAIRDALNTLRRQHYASCDNAITQLQQRWQRVIDAETTSWQQLRGEAPSGDHWEFYQSLTAIDHVSPARVLQEDIRSRRFWSLR